MRSTPDRDMIEKFFNRSPKDKRIMLHFVIRLISELYGGGGVVRWWRSTGTSSDSSFICMKTPSFTIPNVFLMGN